MYVNLEYIENLIFPSVLKRKWAVTKILRQASMAHGKPVRFSVCQSRTRDGFFPTFWFAKTGEYVILYLCNSFESVKSL